MRTSAPRFGHVTLLFALLLALGAGCASNGSHSSGTSHHGSSDWRAMLHEQLPLLGHRNWIVIADSAYPLQSGPGITTIYTGADQISVMKEVMSAVKGSGHVSPIVWMDQELASVPETDAPGVENYRKQIHALLPAGAVQTKPHIDIIKQLDQTAKLFNVLILKTDLKVPYTSVFVQLDCAYWNGDKEQRMRGSGGGGAKDNHAEEHIEQPAGAKSAR